MSRILPACWKISCYIKNWRKVIQTSLVTFEFFKDPLYREVLPKGCPWRISKNQGKYPKNDTSDRYSCDLFNCLKEIIPLVMLLLLWYIEYSAALITSYNRVTNLFVGRHSCAAIWIRNDQASKNNKENKTCWPVNICWHWQVSLSVCLMANLHGTTLSHATSLRQAYDINCCM